ncbi:MAG: ATP-binding cassette domain-containing protein [Labilithrix sp.]
MIRVRGLEKKYGDVHAVRGIDLDVERGEVFGFLGPNGAGKSTTIKILCTLSSPTAGTAAVAGHDVVTARDEVRGQIGLVFQETTLDDYLSAYRNLLFHGELYDVPARELPRRIEETMRMVGLWERKDSPVATFSGGMKRRLEIARGLVHAPKILFLDEPTIGLDPQTRASIWGYIRDLRKDHDITIFLTTHYMDEAENCDRIAIMDAGKIACVDTPVKLKASVGKDQVRLATRDDEAALASLKAKFGIDARVGDGHVLFGVDAGEEFLPRLITELGVPVLSVSVARPSLDDVFLHFTGRAMRDAEAPAPSAVPREMRGRR